MAHEFEVLTVKEVSEMLRIHKATLYRLVKAGKIPRFRIGSDWRFRSDLLKRWMAERPGG
jgi:excisionase family DNA binding protein